MVSEQTPIDVTVEPMSPGDVAPPPARRPRWLLTAVVAVVGVLVGVGGTTAAFLLYDRLDVPEYTFDVTVFLTADVTDANREAVRSALSGVAGVRYESREEAYENFKELYTDEPELVESVRPDTLPASFQFQTEGTEFDCGILAPLHDHPGVDEIVVSGWPKDRNDRDLRPRPVSCP